MKPEISFLAPRELFRKQSTNFFVRNSAGIFLIDGRIHPVEVKSGASGRLKSLHLFLETYQNTPKGIVLSTRPYAQLAEKNIVFVPLYFAFSATRGSGGL